MNRISPILLGLSLSLASGAFAAAQDATPTPPKVLQIARESLRLGKSPAAHDRSGATFVSIAARAKQQGHYIALDSMTGKARSLYITRYPSFEAWEKDNNLVWNNAAIATEMDHAITAEGEFAEGIDFAVFTYSEEWSLRPRPDLSHARYYDISTLHIRPGHRKDFNDCVKMVKQANEKAGTSAHWGAYELAYGGESGTVIALTHRDSLSEIDKDFSESKKLAEAAGGEEGMQKIDEVCGAGIDSSQSELFSINPKQSYAEESWIKSDPDFWKPKAKAAEAVNKPTAAKPGPAASKPGGN
jgi:hypothetical protein